MISIITVAYNAEATILDNLKSIDEQTIPCEHIIVDGFSDDNTLEILQKNCRGNYTILSEPDSGIYDAMNKGIMHASGDIIGLLNADDIYAHPETLAHIEKLFETTDIDSCYGDLCYVDQNDTDKIIRYWQSGKYAARKFFWGWMPPHPTFFARREVYQKYGLFNLDLGSAADYELMLRFLLLNRISCTYLPEMIVKMRRGGESNSSVRNRLKANFNDRKAWKVNGISPNFWTLTCKPLRKLPQWWKRPAFA